MSQNELSRAEAKRLRSLRQRSNREEEGLFLAEGVRVVEELLSSPIVLRTALVSPSLADNPRGRSIATELDARTTLYRVSETELKQIADTETPQGVVVSAIIPRAKLPAEPPRITVVLDGIQDPGNFGTLLRSAVAFGAGLVITLPGTVEAWNGKSIRAAAGTSFQVPIVACDVKTLERWRTDAGVSLWGAAADGSSIRSVRQPRHVALVLGNEGSGLRSDVRGILDQTVALKMKGRAESLNAGVAGGILLYLLSEETA
jgi:TrmH family RNA methyltransferase